MHRSIVAVIPTYNRAALVGRAIESALAQRRPPDEVVVVDDGSTDDTAAVVQRFGHAVTFLRRPHAGVSAARNAGVEQAACDFIAFLDSDDFWLDEHLARIEAAIDATDASAALYFSDLLLPPELEGHSHWAKRNFSSQAPYELRTDATEWLLRGYQPMLMPSAVVRRDAYLALGGSDPTLTRRGDTHLFYKLGFAYPVCAVAGIAGQLTGDDRTSLARAVGLDSETFWRCTVTMYADLLRSFPRLPEDTRERLHLLLAQGHWGLARILGRRQRLSAAAHYLRALRHHPPIFPAKLRELSGRGWKARVLPRDPEIGI